MQFVHQALTWGFLLATVPVLIHLINILRHRRVQWAAMDFLLQSYRKHRKWIWMRQLLLLFLRMAVIGLIVAMLAQWVTRDQWLDIFGGRSTHHYILLDDSMSMSERGGAISAFDVARQVVSRIAQRGATADNPQKLTLLRFSQCQGPQRDDDDLAARIADFNSEYIDSGFDAKFEERRASMDVTQYAVGPEPALRLLKQLLDRNTTEDKVVHVISDFRASDWEGLASHRDAIRELEKAGAELHLVRCTREPQPNLAITSIEPTEDTQAAGVPLFANVSVTNFGPQPARRVQLRTRSIYYDPSLVVAGEIDRSAGEFEDLPTQIIDEIPVGKTETRRIAAYFPKPGQHALEASLVDDALSADNRRWCVVDVPEATPVLIVQGPTGVLHDHAYYLDSVFNPGSRVNTGIRAVTQPSDFLRSATGRELAAFRAIYLLDVGRLDGGVVEKLEEYVRAGGGLAVFVGDNVDVSFYNNQLYKGDAGLLPLPLARVDLLPDRGDETTDIEITDHPIFRVFLGENNSFIGRVTVSRYYRTAGDWSPSADSTARVIARLRNRAPLAVEQRFGQGRVVMFLTTLGPESVAGAWNDWAKEPAFVVTHLLLASYLTQSDAPDDQRYVGAPILVEQSAQQFSADTRLVVPGPKPGTRLAIEQRAEPEDNLLRVTIGADPTAPHATARAGIYEVWLQSLSGSYTAQRFAVNVDQVESDLAVAASQDLMERLSPARVVIHDANEYDWELGDRAGVNRSTLLMACLIAALLCEQWLAYFASYHPPTSLTRAAFARTFAREFAHDSPPAITPAAATVRRCRTADNAPVRAFAGDDRMVALAAFGAGRRRRLDLRGSGLPTRQPGTVVRTGGTAAIPANRGVPGYPVLFFRSRTPIGTPRGQEFASHSAGGYEPEHGDRRRRRADPRREPPGAARARIQHRSLAG